MLLPPEMIMSFERSRSVRNPSSSMLPRSPVMQPAAAQGFGIGFRVLPITLHDAVAFCDDLADLTRRQFAVVFVDDPDQHAGARDTARGQALTPARMSALGVQALVQAGDRHRRLALTKQLIEPRPE